MGTSLSGLTPATTFDGLLKVGDNDPLTADLKAISTGDGTDTILDLSTTAFKVSGETIVEGATTGQFFKVRNASNPTQEFYIEKVDDALNRFNVGTDTTYITYRDGAHLRFVVGGTTHAQLANTGDLSIGLGGSNATARLHVKGSGATSATTSLLVQNSDGADVLQTLDNGSVGVGGPANASYRVSLPSGVTRVRDLVFGQTGGASINNTSLLTMKWNGSTGIGISGGGAIDAAARLHVKGSGNDNTTTSLLVQNSDASASLTYDDSGKVEIVGNSQTGFIQTYGFGAVGFGNESGPTILYGKQGSGLFSAGLHTGSGYTAFGANSSSSQRVLIKGSGATSATTALLVQNSAGTRLMEAQDGGNLFFGAGSSHYLQNGYNWFGSYYFLNTQTFRGALQNDLGSIKIADDLNVGGNADNDTGVRLQVKGSGASGGTTALLVQNSAGDDLLKLEDGGLINIGGSNGYTIQSNLISPKINGYIALDRNSNRTFNIGDNAAARTYLKVQSSLTSDFADVSINTDHLVVKKEGVVGIGETTPTAKLHVKAGTTLDTIARFQDPESATSYLDIKQESGTFSTYTALFYGTDPKIRSKQGGRLYLESSNEIRFTTGVVVNTIFDETGSVAHGSNSLPANTRAYIKGSGATSTTAALLVQNSAGTELLKVRDDGRIYFNGFSTVIDANKLYTGNTGNGFLQINSNRLEYSDSSTSGLSSSAALTVTSTTRGFLPPRMTDAERDAITNPAAGLMIYDTSNNQMNYWNGSTWIAF